MGFGILVCFDINFMPKMFVEFLSHYPYIAEPAPEHIHVLYLSLLYKGLAYLIVSEDQPFLFG
jgi:hypothetical protein